MENGKNNLERTGLIPYRDLIKKETEGSRIWDYLHYDKNGDLWINELRIVDAARRFGTPLEIVDTTIIERRCQEWQELTESVASEINYKGGFEYFFASKANMSAEITAAAYRAGWNAETSSTQDLVNLRWLHERGIIGNDKLKIICNGFKLSPQLYGIPDHQEGENVNKKINFIEDPKIFESTHEEPYADNIAFLRSLGYDITPILDSGELDYFAQEVEIPNMNVGLRMKFGKVHSDEELNSLVSRHGMDLKELRASAEKISKIKHLTLTTLHAMVGAAETIPVDSFVDSLLLAADTYFELRKLYPTLKYFNIGGGIPPFNEIYDHRDFLKKLLTGLKQKAIQANLPEPTVVFELGSYVAAEAGFHVFKIVQEKQNTQNDVPWAIVDGGLMAAIPDMLFIGKEFNILSVNNGNKIAKPYRIGDLSCDSDGRYPAKSMEPKRVFLPPGDDEDRYIMIASVGAYQEILAGVRGAHHCGLLEAAELIIERTTDGSLRARLMPRQTRVNSQEILGYTEDAAKYLRTIKVL